MNKTKRIKVILAVLSVIFILAFATARGLETVETNNSTLASTELINYGSMTSAQVHTFVDLLDSQNISMFIVRINAYSDWSTGQPSASYVSKAKEIITVANQHDIQVAVDLHTWYTTWDSNFDDNAGSSAASNRAKYLTFVTNTIDAFSGSNVYRFMVMNEPQAQTASTSENNFILSVISTAKAATSKPISVRFMAGYSPSTGSYSSAIDTACDFLCRNTYWDARNPSGTVYGSTEAKLLGALSVANNQNKELWITEFGKAKSNLEEQRDYVEHFITWAESKGVDKVFCWVSQPVGGSGESYNIFNGMIPNPAFYELANSVSTTVNPNPQPNPDPSDDTNSTLPTNDDVTPTTDDNSENTDVWSFVSDYGFLMLGGLALCGLLLIKNGQFGKR